MAVAFLHPLADDTVGTSFEAVVAYDFSAFAESIVRVTCTLSGQAATPPFYDVDRSTHPTGELTFSFSGLAAPHDYSLRVTTDPATNGSDTENPIHVTAPNDVPVTIISVNGPTLVASEKQEQEGDGSGTTKSTYRVEGTHQNAQGHKVKVMARSLRVKEGPGLGPVVGRPKDAEMNATTWCVELPVDDDGREYLQFEAKLRNSKANRGRKR